MVKCPFCGFSNEDGALFCEQCKSDLSAVTPAAVENVPMAEVIEATPVAAAHLTPFATAEVVSSALPEGIIPAAEVIAEPPPAIAEVLPEPLPAMAPPLEPEIIAAQAAAAAPPATPAPAAPPAAAASAAGKISVPAGSKPKLVVKRGQKVGFEFPIYAGENYVGRADEKPVDIDLEDQEPPERVWCSRQHAVIHFDEDAGKLTLEDLNSSNGTYVNRERVYPGQPRQLYVNDTIQIGTVHLTLKV
jgi:hypothetical protein